MPAVRAASGLAPTARSSKPNVDRLSSHATTAAASSPRIRPRFVRAAGAGPSSVRQHRRLLCTGLLIASDRAGSCTPFCVMSQLQEEQRDVVQHDRHDDLVGAGAGLEDAGDEAPEPAADDRADQRERAACSTIGRCELEADQAGADRAEDRLALRADVEQAAAERGRDGEAGEDQRRRVGQRLGDRAQRDRPEFVPLIAPLSVRRVEDRALEQVRVRRARSPTRQADSAAPGAAKK